MDREAAVRETVLETLERRGRTAVPITRETLLFGGGLEWDSLTVAEFAVLLEKRFGSEPYSAGRFPVTVGDVVDFYRA